MKSKRPPIAVVDDEAAVRVALTRLFAASGYQVTAYSCASEFLQGIHENMPACLVVDFQMPKMTGLDLQLRLGEAGIDIPIIILTAHDEIWVRERCIVAGAMACLVKPIQTKELLAAVNEAVGKSVRSQRQLAR